jgi:N utilization substance protein B
MKRKRRKARSLALQAVYEIDSVGHPIDQVVARYLDENPSLEGETADFFSTLVLQTLKSRKVLDQLISEHAPEWPVDELAIIDRSILRIALWELALSENTPLKVAINEAVELAKRFGSDSAPRFVNGVLGALVPYEETIRRQLLEAGGV